jgi:hypothetical protein
MPAWGVPLKENRDGAEIGVDAVGSAIVLHERRRAAPVSKAMIEFHGEAPWRADFDQFRFV